MSHFGEMAKLEEEFEDVVFLFVYTKEAHPDDGPSDRSKADDNGGWRIPNNKIKVDAHKSYDERVTAAKELKTAGKENWRVLVDDMDSGAQKAWGNLPNMAWLIAPDGCVAGKWAWVRESTEEARTLLKAEDRTPYTAADDPLLPLRDCTDGEWLTYDEGGEVTVFFSAATKESVARTAGMTRAQIALPEPELGKERAKPDIRVLEVGGIELSCYVIVEGDMETWICPRLPGDGVALLRIGDDVPRVLKDAGFKKGESCLVPYTPEEDAKKEEKAKDE